MDIVQPDTKWPRNDSESGPIYICETTYSSREYDHYKMSTDSQTVRENPVNLQNLRNWIFGILIKKGTF